MKSQSNQTYSTKRKKMDQSNSFTHLTRSTRFSDTDTSVGLPAFGKSDSIGEGEGTSWTSFIFPLLFALVSAGITFFFLKPLQSAPGGNNSEEKPAETASFIPYHIVLPLVVFVVVGGVSWWFMSS